MIALNNEQRAAVEHKDGPALVLAGAGSGKTRVIIERLAHLVEEHGVAPGRLLALTFTNKAANEMRERAAARLGSNSFPAWIGTFHRFGLFLLRRHAKLADRTMSFTVFDDSDQLSLMKRLIKDLPQEYMKPSPRGALYQISGYKQQLESPPSEAECESAEERAVAALWHRYHDAIRRANAFDFDDLLVYPAKILAEHENVHTDQQDRFHYIHVDEYQDTNHAQYEMARMLAGDRANIFVVGDEDQSIYSWRGADINNILDFESDFSDAVTIRLEQNYRSTAPILNAANAVVANNVQRLGKELRTDRKKGDPVRYYEAASGEDEANFIIDDITERKLDPTTVAVLYRTNTQSRAIEEALRRAGMTYRVVGGIQFFQRKEIKDLLAYLRLIANPGDDVSLRRIVNTPTRGIGNTTLEQLSAMAQLREQSLMDTMRDAEGDETLSTRARKSIGEFVNLIDDLALKADDGSLKELVEKLVDDTGYRAFVEESDEKDYKNRIEVVEEFISSCAENDEDDLADFLQDLALVSDADEDTGPCLTLMTCHAAKGLEFPHVYLVGLEEGLLPHASAMGDDDEIEEERRLCYVAMTRACDTLTLASARVRTIYGDRRDTEVSRFLNEIPHGGFQPLVRAADEDEFDDEFEEKDDPVSKKATPEVKMGTRVWHEKFGKGVVMFTRGTGQRMRIKVRFDTGRSREFMLAAAPIRIIER